MSIKYRVVEEVNPLDPEGEKIKKYEIIPQREIGLDEIAEMMEKERGIPVEKTKATIDLIGQFIIEQMSKNEPAQIPFFGTFYPVKRKVKIPGKNGKKGKTIIVDEIEFEANPEWEERLNKNLTFEEVKDDENESKEKEE